MSRYLLGELPEEEQLRMEERFFTDEELYQQLLALEDELKYEYARGGLSSEQRKSFEKRFLQTAADRQKVAVAGSVLEKCYAASAQQTAVAAPLREAQPSWWRSLANLLLPQAPVVRLSLAAAGAVLLVIVSWSVYQTNQLRDRLQRLEAQRRSEQQSEQRELAQERNRRLELERQNAHPQSSTAFLSFILVPGLVRDSDGQKPLVIPADSGTVRIQLDLKKKANYKTYRAEVQTLDGKRIWAQDVPTPTLELPARILPADDYVITLKGITAQKDMEDAGEYYFTVIRK